jgi:tRNA(adenine34) deaminase
MQAITSATNFLGGKYLKDCTMYVTLEPCVMCAGALAWSQISNVVIGARDEKRGFINKNLQLHPKTEIITGILENECSVLVKAFFKEKR